MATTPTTSGRPLVVAMVVNRTPQGTLTVQSDEQVLLERSASGSLREFRPQNISGGEGVDIYEESQSNLRPENENEFRPQNISDGEGMDIFEEYQSNLRPENESDEEDIFNAPLTEALDDSGSEEDEHLTLEEDEQLTLEEDDQSILEELVEILGEDEEEDNLDQNFTWSDDYATFSGVRENFQEEVGPKIEGTSPLGLFTQIWDLPLLEMIVRETNHYAWQTIAKASESATGISTQSRLNDWVETSVVEIYRLIAVMITMGMCLRGRIDEYWTTGRTGMPDFRSMMSKNRFLLLLRFLHFADNDFILEHGTERKIAKITPVVDYLNMKFKAVYSPRRELSLDESLLLWKGRLSWVQCIRTKAARFGIKSYELCEAVSGYVLNIMIYTGKTTGSTVPMFGFISSTAKIVIKLMLEYLGKGHALYMDNFYNSVHLARWLKSKKTDVVGTLNRRRVGTPADIKGLLDKRLARGSVVSRHCGDISVLAWKDVKLVTTVSTFHTPELVPGRRAGRNIQKPAVVENYNKFMGGVDLKDQKLSMYLLERKRGLKWYIKVFRRLLNISILNAYIMYTSNIGQDKKMTHREFRSKLVDELCDSMEVPTRMRYPGNPIARHNPDKHGPEHVELSGERSAKQVRYKRARCARCLEKGQRKDTNIICNQCKVFLCVGQCWREYHA